MSDFEDMSSDSSDNEVFDEDFIDSIPDDSDYDGDVNANINTSPLILEVGMSFHTWKAAFNYIKK